MRVGRKYHTSQSPSSPSPSPIQVRRRRRALGKSSKSKGPEKNLLVLTRCKSEPTLWRSSDETGGDDHRRLRMSPVIAALEEVEEEEVLFRPQTCSAIFVSPDYVVSSSPPKYYEGSHNKDAKVVVSVTVEGSPGPIRTMVKLSCNVEEAISVVVRKYNAEGRTPPLELIENDDRGASNFELHSSYFSLESLNKTDVIGNIGSRNFYLRKRNCKKVASTSIDSDTISNDRANTCLPLPFLDMSWKIEVMTKTRKLWRILGCLQSSS